MKLQKKKGGWSIVAISDSNGQNKAQQYASNIFNEVVKLGANAGNVSLNARISEKTPVAEVQIFVK